MTPEQEARRALHGGTSRGGLSPAVRAEYDRMLEQVGNVCGDAIKDGCKHIMTGGCPFTCFWGPCKFEEEARS